MTQPLAVLVDQGDRDALELAHINLTGFDDSPADAVRVAPDALHATVADALASRRPVVVLSLGPRLGGDLSAAAAVATDPDTAAAHHLIVVAVPGHAPVPPWAHGETTVFYPDLYDRVAAAAGEGPA